MKRYQQDRLWLCLWICCYLLLSVSILLMAADATSARPDTALIWLPGILFWLSLLGSIAIYVVLACRRRRWYQNSQARRGRFMRGIGIISFFKNRYAMVADVSMMASLCALVVSFWLTNGHGWVAYLCTAWFLFSFSMHCVLNGKIFYYVTHRNVPSQTDKKQQGKSIVKEGEEDND